MVQAILEGRKVQTRRIAKEFDHAPGVMDGILSRQPYQQGGPYGKPGDRLWVRETHLVRGAGTVVDYRADFDPIDAAGHGAFYGGWKPSLFMRREHSRITLEVTGVRVERLNDISDEDAIDEGIDAPIGSLWTNYAQPKHPCTSAVQSFHSLWDSINGHESWFANPWVWRISFQRIEP